MKRGQINAAIGIIVIIAFFLGASFIVQNNLEYVRVLIGTGYISMLIFMFILIIATVIAPVNAIPLLPVASAVWGWFMTGILSIISWTAGAMIAFGLSRRFGVPLVRKFISLENIQKYEKLVPEENIFWSIILMRMAIPVDLLSYVLGLFSRIKISTYFFATLIGITPMAFVLAFAGTLPIRYQILAFLAAVLVLLIGLKIRKMYNLSKMLKEKVREIEDIVNTDKLKILKTDGLIKD